MIQHNQKGIAMPSNSQYNLKPHKVSGFSLIELMIVVAIIGIIAAIALPGYSEYVRRGKAAEATSTLADLKNKMEQYYQDNRTYEDVGDLTAPCAPAEGTVKYFIYSCTTQSVDEFTLNASSIDDIDMDGFNFTINQAGEKTSTFSGSAEAACWLNSKTGSCS